MSTPGWRAVTAAEGTRVAPGVTGGPGVRPLAGLARADAATVGGKAAGLGELIAAGFAVPPGFVVTAPAYREAMRAGGVLDALDEGFDRLLARVGAGEPGDDPAPDCARLQELVRAAGPPPELAEEIHRAYAALADGSGPVAVAVRSSAIGEDSGTHSFAGIHSSFTHVRGEDELDRRVADCWASAFAPRALAYRAGRGLAGPPAVAVVVQRMVESDCAGVAFTADPVTGRTDRVVVEPALGLGEVVVGGLVEPDTSVFSLPGLDPVFEHIGVQTHAVVPGPDGHDRSVALDPDRASARVLTPDRAAAVARLAERVQEHFGAPQDVEWALEGDTLYLVQARPVTTTAGTGTDGAGGPGASGEVLVTGVAAAPGRRSGPARILSSPADGAQLTTGDVLVAPRTDPDWLPTLRRAAAVVTDHGGVTCHAAIVARELGIPCVVGSRTATTDIAPGRLVTVDGGTGTVSAGAVRPATAAVARHAAAASPEPLATEVHVNVATPQAARRAAALPVDGVGLLRAEIALTDALRGRHPLAMIAAGDAEEFVTAMAGAVGEVGEAFRPRPVLYRAADLRSNEFRLLTGGADHEPVERNPMIGFRGAYRYLREPELFRLELRMLARVRERCPNVHLMLPFVRTRWELAAVLDLVDGAETGRDRLLQRWLTAEVPSVVHWLPEYVAAGVDGVSIGSNDLTQLVLGVDRDSERLAELYDESDPAVLAAITAIVELAALSGVPSSLCGQAPSRDPAFVRHLVEAGITAVSVDPDAVGAVRRAVGAAERRLLLDAARRGAH